MESLNKRKIIKGICFVLIFLAIFFPLQAVFQVKWLQREPANIPVTASWDEYKSLEKNSVDVFFVGTSHVYAAIDPMYIYEHSGITSFNVTSPALRMDVAYMLLKEALKTQSPKVVFLDMSSIKDKKQIGEAKAHKALDMLPISLDKIRYAFTSGSKGMKPLDVLFPFFRYHSRWSELTRTDFSYLIDKPELTADRGHFITYLTQTAEFRFYKEYNFNMSEKDASYIRKIKGLCDEAGAELVLMKVPTPSWREAISRKAAEFAETLEIPYLELYYEFETMGLDVNRDFRDKKSHMNQWGAEKVSSYMIAYLQENYELEDQRDTNERWNEDLVKYREDLKELYALYQETHQEL